MPHQRVRAAVAVVGVAALGAFLMSGNAAAAGGKRAVVPDVKPAWATSARATGTAPTSQSVSIRVGLKMRDQAGAEGLVRDLSDPSSPRYGHYLTPKAFTTRFAPTAASVDRVSSYLQSQGLKVTGVAQGNQWVNASGTVAQLNKAFATTLKTYSYRGKTLRAPETSVTVPAAVQADVSTVSGLSQRATHMTPQHVSVPSENTPKAKARSAGPTATPPPASQCSDYWGEYQQTVPKVDGKTRVNTYICGYTAAQLRTIYGTAKTVAKGNDGHGVTVAIIDAYANPTMEADANRYFGLVGEPAFKAGQYSETTFKPFNDQDLCGGEDGWNGEQALDVEAVHGMAPGANIHYVGAQNCAEGIDVALNDVVQNHTADIVSNSYGDQGEQDLGDEVAIEHAMFLQAGAEGIGMYFSSGDDGDNVINGLDPATRLPGLGHPRHRRRRHERTDEQEGCVEITTGWETSLNFIDYTGTKAQYRGPVPGRVRLRRRRRHQHPVHAAVLPAVRGAAVAGEPRRDPDAGRAGRLGGRRPVHRLLLRLHLRWRVRPRQDRGHQPVHPADGGHPGGGRTEPGVPDRFRQPADLLDAGERVQRRHAAGTAPVRQRGRQLHRHLRSR